MSKMIMPIVTCATFGLAPSVHGAAEYAQELHYVGMSCGHIGKDSLAHPANEIFINALVHTPESGQSYAHKLPHDRKVYRDVRTGSVVKGPSRLLWQGRQQALELRVWMWEHDDGGKAVGVFSELLTNAAIELLSKGGGSKGGSSAPPGQPVLEADKDPLTKLFAKTGRELLGTGHDLLGYAHVTLRAGDWSQGRSRRVGDMRFHVATRHTRNGARCNAYFRFQRGERVSVAAPTPKSAPAHRPSRAMAPRPAPVSDAHCRVAFDRCTTAIRQCEADARAHNQRADACVAHGKAQLPECVAHYQAQPSRRNEARAVCNARLASHLEGCPKKLRAWCGDYRQCDDQYRGCAAEAARRAQSHAPPAALPPQSPPPRTVRPTAPAPPPARRSVTLNIVNRCPHLGSVAFHYQTGRARWKTEGWATAYLDRKSTFTISPVGDDIYVHSAWGRVDDRAGRSSPKRLPVTNKPFSYAQPATFDAPGKRMATFYPMKLPSGKREVDVVLVCR